MTKLFSKSGSPSSVKLLAPQQQSASTRAGYVCCCVHMYFGSCVYMYFGSCVYMYFGSCVYMYFGSCVYMYFGSCVCTCTVLFNYFQLIDGSSSMMY